MIYNVQVELYIYTEEHSDCGRHAVRGYFNGTNRRTEAQSWVNGTKVQEISEKECGGVPGEHDLDAQKNHGGGMRNLVGRLRV